jgi:bla regulator protein blaR1
VSKNSVLSVVLASLAVFIPIASGAQGVNAQNLAFEVATIKRSVSDGPFRGQFLPGGRVHNTNYTLRMLILVAYDMLPNHVVGGPGWVDSDRYDVEAKAASGVIPENDGARVPKTRQMLRALLVERFKLAVHRETREEPVYALTVAKGGPKLPKPQVDPKDCMDDVTPLASACHTFIGGQGRGLTGRTVNISDLVGVLSMYTDRPVIDKTGLNGAFDIKLDPWAPLIRVGDTADRESNLRDPERPSLFVLLEEQLGLKLEGQKGQVEVLVIDRAEKPVTEN